MHVNPTDTIAGVNILTIRKFLRRSGRVENWGMEFISSLLKMNAEQAMNLLIDLENKGYIEKDELYYGEQYWHNAVSGNTLGGASAAKPYKRRTAENVLNKFMDRVQRVNSDSYYLYKVTKVVLFGSYLTNAPEVNDVDIAIEVKPKTKGGELLGQQLQHRREELEKNGKRFSNVAEWAGAAEIEVWSFLKSHSRVLSLHIANDELLNLIGGRVIFTET